MSVFSRLFQARDKPGDLRRAEDALGGGRFSFFFGGSTSGKAVNERTAMQMTAVYSYVRILSEAVAGLPLHVYRYEENGGKEKALDHPLYLLLHDEPNPEMSSFNFRETLIGHLLLYGNAYAQIIRNGRGEVAGLYPLMPSKMTVDRDSRGGCIICIRGGRMIPRWVRKMGRFICRRSRCFIFRGWVMTGL